MISRNHEVEKSIVAESKLPFLKGHVENQMAWKVATACLLIAQSVLHIVLAQAHVNNTIGIHACKVLLKNNQSFNITPTQSQLLLYVPLTFFENPFWSQSLGWTTGSWSFPVGICDKQPFHQENFCIHRAVGELKSTYWSGSIRQLWVVQGIAGSHVVSYKYLIAYVSLYMYIYISKTMKVKAAEYQNPNIPPCWVGWALSCRIYIYIFIFF